MIRISPTTQLALAAYASDVAESLIEKWGQAVITEPVYTEESGWYVIVIGLLEDIQMDTIKVLSNGTQQKIA